MKRQLFVIAIATLGVGVVRADPLDGRVRSFRVSFPLSWKGSGDLGADERRLAAYALLMTGGGSTLARLALEGELETKRAAIWAMQFAWDESYEDGFRKAAGDYRLSDEAFELAVAAGPESPAAQHVWHRALAYCRFADFPPNAVARLDPGLQQTRQDLRRAVASPDEWARCGALVQLTQAGAKDDEVLDAALALARDDSYRTRYWAAEYVAKCGLEDPRAFEALLHAVRHGAGAAAASALTRFKDRARETGEALLPVLSGAFKREMHAYPEDEVRIAQLLCRQGVVSDDVVRFLGGAAGGHWIRDGVPVEPSLSLLKDSPECLEIVLRKISPVLPRLGLAADRYGERFAVLLNQERSLATVLEALPAGCLAREVVRSAVRRHSASEDRAVALAARLALWRGDVDRAELVAWARGHPGDREPFLRSIEPARHDAKDDLDRAIVEMLLDPPMPDRLSRFGAFAAEIRTSVEPLLGEPRSTFEAARCLAQLGFRSPAIEAGLKSRLVDGTPAYAAAAMEGCAAAGIDLVGAYTALLPDARACLWLGLAGPASANAAPRLVQLVTHKDCGPAALWALGEIRAPLEAEAHDRIAAILVAEQPLR